MWISANVFEVQPTSVISANGGAGGFGSTRSDGNYYYPNSGGGGGGRILIEFGVGTTANASGVFSPRIAVVGGAAGKVVRADYDVATSGLGGSFVGKLQCMSTPEKSSCIRQANSISEFRSLTYTPVCDEGLVALSFTAKPCSISPLSSTPDRCQPSPVEPNISKLSQFCAKCPNGYAARLTNFTDTPFVSMTTCVKCPQGLFSLDGVYCDACVPGNRKKHNASCKMCAPGQFTYTRGCRHCPPGKFAPDHGAIGCQVCPGGLISSAGAAICSRCPAGFKPHSKTSNACERCPVGRFGTIFAECKICNYGQYRNSSDTRYTSCRKCAAGKFLADDANDVTLHTDISHCSTCEEGKFSNPGYQYCFFCNFGEYLHRNASSSSAAISCKECAKGQYADGINEPTCKLCEEGRYQDKTKEANCFMCLPGLFADVRSAQRCKQCDANTFSSKPGATNCSRCDPGEKSNPGAAKCTPCDAGEAGTGKAGECEPCRVG